MGTSLDKDYGSFAALHALWLSAACASSTSYDVTSNQSRAYTMNQNTAHMLSIGHHHSLPRQNGGPMIRRGTSSHVQECSCDRSHTLDHSSSVLCGIVLEPRGRPQLIRSGVSEFPSFPRSPPCTRPPIPPRFCTTHSLSSSSDLASGRRATKLSSQVFRLG